jgi:hypothetical protein
MYLLIVNMGTLLSLKELIAQWKTIVIALSGILGIVALLLLVGSFILDLKTVIVAIPPLVGGVVSAMLMSDAANLLGLKSLGVLAVLIYIVQGFAGYPLTSIMLKKEGKRLLKLYRNGELKVKKDTDENSNEKQEATLFSKLPEKYKSNNYRILKVAIVGAAAYFTSTLLKPIVDINTFVLCLAFGVIASSIGFLEKEPLVKSNSFGFTILILMLFVFDGLKNATPQMIKELAFPMVTIIVIGVLGMYIFSWIAGKFLHVSKEMAFSISLTALYGFPADYIITNEVITSLVENDEEKEVLLSHMLPPMLVGGFITVTIVSVVIAGVFSTWLTTL